MLSVLQDESLWSHHRYLADMVWVGQKNRISIPIYERAAFVLFDRFSPKLQFFFSMCLLCWPRASLLLYSKLFDCRSLYHYSAPDDHAPIRQSSQDLQRSLDHQTFNSGSSRQRHGSKSRKLSGIRCPRPILVTWSIPPHLFRNRIWPDKEKATRKELDRRAEKPDAARAARCKIVKKRPTQATRCNIVKKRFALSKWKLASA